MRQCLPQIISSQGANFPDRGAVRRQKGTEQEILSLTAHAP